MATTYDPIATTTLGSSASTVSFTSISSLYTDLIIVATPIGDGGTGNIRMTFNTDTGSNYSGTEYGIASNNAVSAARNINLTSILLTDFGYYQDNTKQNTFIHIFNYANTSMYKTVIARSNNDAVGTGMTAGLWRNTNAITSIQLPAEGSNYATGSIFTLYGIKGA